MYIFSVIFSKEMKRACEKKMPYDFTYLVLICKLYKSEKTQAKQKRKKQQNILWSNPEEELLDQVCTNLPVIFF